MRIQQDELTRRREQQRAQQEAAAAKERRILAHTEEAAAASLANLPPASSISSQTLYTEDIERKARILAFMYVCAFSCLTTPSLLGYNSVLLSI